MTSTMCTGIRMVRAWSAMARVMAWRMRGLVSLTNGMVPSAFFSGSISGGSSNSTTRARPFPASSQPFPRFCLVPSQSRPLYPVEGSCSWDLAVSLAGFQRFCGVQVFP